MLSTQTFRGWKYLRYKCYNLFFLSTFWYFLILYWIYSLEKVNHLEKMALREMSEIEDEWKIGERERVRGREYNYTKVKFNFTPKDNLNLKYFSFYRKTLHRVYKLHFYVKSEIYQCTGYQYTSANCKLVNFISIM